MAAIVVAELAVIVLAPAQPGPPPMEVDASAFFEGSDLERAQSYRTDARLIALAALAIELAVLAGLALGRPRRLQARLGQLERRPWLAAAVAGAAVSVIVAVAALPTGFASLELRTDFGLSTQSSAGWLYDRFRSTAIAAALAAVGAVLLVWLQRRLPRRWWLAAAAAVVSYAVVLSFLAPVVLAPIFNDFEPIGEGRTRSDVLDLAARAGVEIDDVYRIDASSRATTLNAYVDGIGSTRRVVLYDNLLDAAERSALRWVVAHELGHVSRRDIPRGLLFVAIVAPVGMLFVREAGGALADRIGSGPGRARAVPAYAFAIALAGLGLGLVGNQLSRAVEERADRFALELSGDPDGMIALQTIVAERNLSDPDPPAVWQSLFGTHPTKLERLGLAEAYRDRSDG